MAKQELSPIFKFAILSIPATILLVFPTFADPINLPKLLALLLLAFISLLLLIALRRYTQWRQDGSLEAKAIIALYSLIAIGMVVSGFSSNGNYIRTIFGTSGRNNGLIYFLSVITLAIILLRLVVGKLEIDYIYKILSITSILFSIYCALQYFYLDPIKWSNPYNRVIGTLGNPNFSSSALATFAVFWLYLSTQRYSQVKSRKIIALLLASSMALLSWSTQSLQGLVVLALGTVLVLYIWLREKSTSKVIPYLFFIGGGLSLSFAFISFAGLGPLGSTLEQYTLKLRGFYAYFGIRGMLESPWNGVGVDNYISAFRAFRTPEFVAKYGVALTTNNAHSTPAQVGAAFGLLVFLLYSALHLWILYKALKVINSRDTSLNYLKGISILWILVFGQSLLSIEIIGLGVLNWILGAILLSSLMHSKSSTHSQGDSNKRGNVKKNLPAWVGSLTIAGFAIGSIPVVLISLEDKAYRNVITMRVDGQASKDWVRENYSKLTKFTLLDSDKALNLVNNVYESGMNAELEILLKNLQSRDPGDVYSNDLLASYYLNTNQLDKELEIREELRQLDPINYQLELVLARAYARGGDIANLEDSLKRIRVLAPDSQEFKDAQELLTQSKATP
jgi:hypothetical protein